jgi:hypothetical protein
MPVEPDTAGSRPGLKPDSVPQEQLPREASLRARGDQEGSTRLAILGLALMLLLSYVGSVGPAAMFVRRTKIGEKFAGFVYAPLIWARQNTPLQAPLDLYIQAWEAVWMEG